MAASPNNSFAAPPGPSCGSRTGEILVTGATGFIGRVLTHRAQATGLRVRCLVRDRQRALRLGLPEPSLREGALDDIASLRRAAEDCTAVVHLAGATRAFGAAGFQAANAEGTASLAAAVADGSRFVLVSSLAAAGPSLDGTGTALPPDECRPCSLYGASKRDGELRLLEHRDRLDWCVVRPPIVYGPGDDATQLLIRQALGVFAPVPLRRRPLSLIFVDDLVELLLRVLDASGIHGFVPADGPERSDTSALVLAIAAAAGHRARRLPVPMPLVRCLGPALDLFQRLRGRPGFLCSDKLREASARGWVADPEPARTLFGFVARTSVADGFRASFDPPR